MPIPLLDNAVTAAYPAVLSVADALGPFGGAATAIIACTAGLRLLLLPLAVAAVRGERARERLAPRARQLQQRHRNDPARLRTELAAMYKDAGISPAAGCLPVLAQAPFFMIWFRIFTATDIAGHSNLLLAQQFFGTPLSARLIGGGGHLPVFLPLLLVLAVLALVTLLRARRVAAATGAPLPPAALALLPFTSLGTALVLPLAAVLYVVTTMFWSTAENILLRRGRPAR